MSVRNCTADGEGNTQVEEGTYNPRDSHGYFRKHTYDSFEVGQEEDGPIYDYMLKRQCNPETLDEICRQTGVDMG